MRNCPFCVCVCVCVMEHRSDRFRDHAAQRLAEDDRRPEQNLLLAHSHWTDTVHQTNWREHGKIGTFCSYISDTLRISATAKMCG